MEAFQFNLGFWLVQTVAMLLTCLLLPRLKVSGPIPALVTVATLAFVNAHLWDAALFFSIPDSPTVHTAMLLVANGVIFWVVVKILPGIEIEGVLPAIAAPVVFTVCSLLVGQANRHVDWPMVYRRAIEYSAQARSYFEGKGEGNQQADKHAVSH